MENSPLITVAIAAYKVEKYIKRSLLSVLNQTYRNLEILVINDGTPDHSPVIVQQIKAGHPRGAAVRIISHPHNIGTGAVRNTAIDEARGRYLFFMDGDDYLTPDCLTTLLAAMLRHHDDFVCASHRKVTEAGNLIYNINMLPGHYIGRFAISQWMAASQQLFPMYIWNKLFDLDFLRRNKIRCIPRHHNEDVWFSFQLFKTVTACSFLPDVTLNYVIRQGSIMNQKISDFFLDQYEEIFRLGKELLDNLIITGARPPKAYFHFFGHYFLAGINEEVLNAPFSTAQKTHFYQLIKTMTEHFRSSDFDSLYFRALFQLLGQDLTYEQYATSFRLLTTAHKSYKIANKIGSYLHGWPETDIIREDTAVWLRHINKWLSQRSNY